MVLSVSILSLYCKSEVIHINTCSEGCYSLFFSLVTCKPILYDPYVVICLIFFRCKINRLFIFIHWFTYNKSPGIHVNDNSFRLVPHLIPTVQSSQLWTRLSTYVILSTSYRTPSHKSLVLYHSCFRGSVLVRTTYTLYTFDQLHRLRVTGSLSKCL